MTPRKPSGTTGLSDHLLAVMLVAASVGLLLVMLTTSSTSDGDSFDSSLYWWSWLIIPGAAVAASLVRPRPLLWTAALILPIIVAVALLGTVFHDPDDGASLWMASELVVLVQGAITYGAASVGAACAGRR